MAVNQRATITPFPSPLFTPPQNPAFVNTPAESTMDAHEAQQRSHRTKMLAKVHVAKARLGIDDDTWRAMLQSLFKVRSSADLGYKGLHALCLHLQSKGFAPSKGGKKPAPAPGCAPRMKKIEALLAEKGNAEGTQMPWAYAVGILKRQTNGEVRSLDKAEPHELDAVIAALVRDARRKGRYTEQWGQEVE